MTYDNDKTANITVITYFDTVMGPYNGGKFPYCLITVYIQNLPLELAS